MARRGRPDKREIRANQVTRGTEATPGGLGTRVMWEIRDRRATPDGRVTRDMWEIPDKRATPAIAASPVHAQTDSITIPIQPAEG
jgi:hypothetical protein